MIGVWVCLVFEILEENVGLQREVEHPIYMVLLKSGAATINWLRLLSWRVVKESP
jgi:hypothetical protein